MKTISRLYWPLAIILSAMIIFCGCRKEDTGSRIKVLLDTDMIEGFDDGVALMMLLGAENIDLVGITTETGNNWATEGVAHAIGQMEICNVHDIPVIKGYESPYRDSRYETMLDEILRSKGVMPSWYGACGWEKPSSWKDVYADSYTKETTITPNETDAADFIIDAIKSAPGEITVLAIGPTTNIAKALAKAPEIASMAKEIIYMCGAFYCDGNITVDAEVNVFYDPEAEQICFKAPWPKQTIVSLDVCNTVMIGKSEFDTIIESTSNADIRKLLKEGRIGKYLEANPDGQAEIWDTISAALAIDSSILFESNVETVDVNVDPSDIRYGKTIINNSDSSCKKAVIPIRIDNKKFWTTIYTSLSRI